MKKMNMSHDQLMHGINSKEKMPKMPKGAKAMKKGGPTSMDMKKMGRNMARVKNQRGR